MALTVDGNELFGDGPAVVTAGPVERQFRDQAYPGVVGRTRLNLRGDVRRLVQTGIMVVLGDTVSEAHQLLWDLVNVIEGHDLAGTTPLCLGVHTLVDDDGVTWADVTLDQLEPGRVVVIPVSGGYEARMPYRASWTQLVPVVPTPPEEPEP